MYHLTSRRGLHPRHDAKTNDVQTSMESDGLLPLLRRFHGSKATNPRDRLFALLGLASLSGMERLREDLQQLNIKSDYGIEVKHLFIRLAEAIFRISGSLDLLSITSSRADWPSWVPDWSNPSQQIEALSFSSSPVHHSSGNSKPHPLVDGDVLVLNGIFIDNVDRVVDYNVTQHHSRLCDSVKKNPGAADHSWLDSMVRLELICWQVLEWESLEPSEYPSGADRIDIYWSLFDAACKLYKPTWYDHLRRSNQTLVITNYTRWLVRKCPIILWRGYLRPGLTVLGSGGSHVYDAHMLQSKTIARTAKGYLVFAPIATKVGDAVTIFQGGRVPFIVHRDDTNGPFRLRGECYVPGMMNGELWCEEKCHEIRIA